MTFLPYSVLVVNELLDLFPNDLPRVPPPREIGFCVDIELDTKPILVPPCRISSTELKDLKLQL